MQTPAVAPLSPQQNNWPSSTLINLRPGPKNSWPADHSNLLQPVSIQPSFADALGNNPTPKTANKYPYAWQFFALGVGAVGIWYNKQILGFLKQLPKTITNLPQAINNSKESFLNWRIKRFSRYASALSTEGQKINILPVIDMKYKNLSINDISTRLGILGVYIPQGIMAIHYQRHPYETWVRNILAWVSTNVILQSIKDPKSYYSSFKNQFLVPKKQFKPLGKKPLSYIGLAFKKPFEALDRALNIVRTDWNYLKWLDKAGISLKSLGVKEDINKAIYKEAFWSKLDINEMRLIENTAQRLLKKHQLYGPRPLLKQQAMQIASFIRRVSGMHYFANISMAVAQIYIAGLLVPIVTFILTDKLDKRFERPVNRYYLPKEEKNSQTMESKS